jgi:hypothetical protein
MDNPETQEVIEVDKSGTFTDPNPQDNTQAPVSVVLALVGNKVPAATPRIQITPTGVQFLGKMTYGQWREALFAWKKGGDIFHIGLADFIEYGKKEFGEAKVDETLELFDFDMADVLKSHAIGQLPLDLRDVTLTSEHYYILAKGLPSATKEQGRWAAIAKKESLTPIELKRSIEKGEVVKQAEIERTSGQNSGVPNIEGLAMTFQRWTKQVGGEDVVLRQPDDWKRKFLDEVHPIVELAQKVESTLPDPEPEPAERAIVE